MACTTSMLRVAPRASSVKPAGDRTSPVPRASAQAAAAVVSRRQLAAAFGASLAVLAAPLSASAYGGTANLRNTDSGAGNSRFDDLVAANKASGTPKLDVEAFRKKTAPVDGEEEVKSRIACSTGREKGCQ